MRVSTTLVGTLLGAGAALGMAIETHSTRDLDRRGDQISTLYYCVPEFGGEQDLFFAVFEKDMSVQGPCNPGDAVINKPNDNTSLMKYTDFEFRSYGVTCRFFVDTDFDSLADQQLAGHADCPVHSDIKGKKVFNEGTQPVTADGCGVRCTSQIEIPMN